MCRELDGESINPFSGIDSFGSESIELREFAHPRSMHVLFFGQSVFFSFVNLGIDLSKALVNEIEICEIGNFHYFPLSFWPTVIRPRSF